MRKTRADHGSKEDLGMLLFAVARMIKERVVCDSEGKKTGAASMLQLKTLGLIKRLGNPSMMDIARNLQITSPSATSLMRSLEKAGEVKRVRDPADKRIVRIAITDKGETSLTEGIGRVAKHINNVLSPLTSEEKGQLAAIFSKIINI